MAAISPLSCDFNDLAPDFNLLATDGKHYQFSDIAGKKATLVMFICNHCPFVLAILDRMIRDASDLQKLGVGVAAICSNDAESYPADNFDNMQKMAEQHHFPFVYLHDVEQTVAKHYGAVCTPDFFGFNQEHKLQYRGRLDASRMQAAPEGQPRELFEAMRQIAATGLGPLDQIASIGCSIKWKP